MACIGEEGLARYLAGDLDSAAHRRVEAHLVGCADCAEILEELTMRTEIRAVAGDAGGRLETADKLLWLERHYGLQIGDVIAGKYRIEKVIGEGGMGIIVRATHLALREKVALKFMHPSMAENPTHAARFVREARAAVRLREEHVARVLDLGEIEGTGPYIVMEYLEGIDLLEHLKRHAPLPVAEAVELCRQAASGVAAAHEAGVVHRDLKPGNMFLTDKRGRKVLKVLDFGVSKYLEGDSLAVTKTNMVVGSPMYMAPELFETARNATPASDVWALGVIFYRMLTGRLPFFGESLPELVAKVHFGRPTPITHWRPELPGAIGRILERCLARDPAARFPDARALLEAMDRLPAAALSQPAPAPGTPPPDPIAPYTLPPQTLADVPGPAMRPLEPVASPAPPRLSWVLIGVGATLATALFGVIVLATSSSSTGPAVEPDAAVEIEVTPEVIAAPDPAPRDAPEITADAAAPEPARERRVDGERRRERREARERERRRVEAARREAAAAKPKEPVLLIPESDEE